MLKFISFITSLFVSTYAFAQPFAGQTLTMSQYEVMVDAELASQARFLDDMKEDVSLALKGKDWLTDRLASPIYGILINELEAAWQVKVAHKDTLQAVSMYSPYGYPVSSIKKAIASGRGDFFARVFINLNAAEIRSHNTADPFGISKQSHQSIRPRIQITLKVYDRAGELVYKGKSKIKSDDFFKISTYYLLDCPVPVGGERPKEDQQVDSLMGMVIEAIYQLLPLQSS